MVCRDRRGASLVEYILVVGTIALLALLGARAFGSVLLSNAERKARCVWTLSACEGVGATESAASPPAPAGYPGRTTNRVAQQGDTEIRDDELASTLVQPRGSGTKHDAAIVAKELSQLPLPVLKYMSDNGIHVIAAEGSVTDYYTDLKGVRPRGWPPGSTWDSVPGVGSGKDVVIAVRNGRVPPTGDGHGCYSLLLHETFHGIDYVAPGSSDPDFLAARKADEKNLPGYLRQPGVAGPEETFAETAGRYYGGDPSFATDEPHLYEYWQTHDKILFPDRPRGRGGRIR